MADGAISIGGWVSVSAGPLGQLRHLPEPPAAPDRPTIPVVGRAAVDHSIPIRSGPLSV